MSKIYGSFSNLYDSTKKKKKMIFGQKFLQFKKIVNKKRPISESFCKSLLNSLHKEVFRIKNSRKGNEETGVSKMSLFLDEIINYMVLKSLRCHSNIICTILQIQRDCRSNLYDSEKYLNLFRKFRITRPSFKSVAKIIGTYCHFSKQNHFPEKSKHYASEALKIMYWMESKHNLTPNTYLVNRVIVALSQNGQRSLFWELVLNKFDKRRQDYDIFTYGCILSMCIKEENSRKFDLFLNFYRKHKKIAKHKWIKHTKYKFNYKYIEKLIQKNEIVRSSRSLTTNWIFNKDFSARPIWTKC